MSLAVLLLVSAIAGFTESPLYRRLFTPVHVPDGTYRTYVTPRALDEVLADLESVSDGPQSRLAHGTPVEPTTVVAAEAFGQSGGYDRWKLARLYGARRARVARLPRMEGGQVVEAWTLISPYPDPALERLEPGTLLIVLRLR
jgi:hypothetical protein